MTEAQERHLHEIKTEFVRLVDSKYRKGQAEHGGDLFKLSDLKLIECAIDEAIDQVVYLLTLRQNMIDAL